MNRALAPLASLLFVAAACSSNGGGAAVCTAGYFGDPAAPPRLELRALDATYTDVPLVNGGDVAMLLPPQGGRVIFVGVRATNVDGCGVQLTGALRDTTSRQVRVDARTVNLNDAGDGWGSCVAPGGVAQIASYANVPLCPNQWADKDVFDVDYELSVTLRDRNGKTAVDTIHVVPRCAEPANLADCRCICKGGYVLGEACDGDGDAGADAASDATADAAADGPSSEGG